MGRYKLQFFFSVYSGFIGQIFTGELYGLDSGREVEQAVICNSLPYLSFLF